MTFFKSIFTFGKRLLKFVFACVFVAALAWCIANSIDEAPTSQAVLLREPVAHDVPDAANAWLYLLGLGAAEGEDPIAVGRRRLALYEARARQIPMPPVTEEEKTLAAGHTPFALSIGAGDKGKEICDTRKSECMAWSAEQATWLTQLAASNALRLQRYETLLGMTEIDNLATPRVDVDVLITNLGAPNRLYLALIARDVSMGGNISQSLRRLRKSAAFWQRVAAQGQALILKQVAEVLLEQHWRLLDEIIAQLSMDQLRAMQPEIDAILQPASPQQRDWYPTIKHEYAVQSHVFEDAFHSPFNSFKLCTRNDAVKLKSCLFDLLASSAYLPNATHNLMASYHFKVAKLSTAPFREYLAQKKEFEASLIQYYPLASTESSLRMLAYNGVGKILFATFIVGRDNMNAAVASAKNGVRNKPAFHCVVCLYIERQHDREALRRMLVIKQNARVQGISNAQMPRFLKRQDEALRNPYTGEPFEWSGAKNEMHVTPLAEHSPGARFYVKFHQTPIK